MDIISDPTVITPRRLDGSEILQKRRQIEHTASEDLGRLGERPAERSHPFKHVF